MKPILHQLPRVFARGIVGFLLVVLMACGGGGGGNSGSTQEAPVAPTNPQVADVSVSVNPAFATQRITIPPSPSVTVVKARGCQEGLGFGVGTANTMSRDTACVLVFCPTSAFQYTSYVYASAATEQTVTRQNLPLPAGNALRTCNNDGYTAYHAYNRSVISSNLFKQAGVYPWLVIEPNPSALTGAPRVYRFTNW